MIEGCLDLSLLAMMEASLADTSNWGVFFSYCVSIICLIALLAILIWTRLSLRKKDLTD